MMRKRVIGSIAAGALALVLLGQGVQGAGAASALQECPAFSVVQDQGVTVTSGSGAGGSTSANTGAQPANDVPAVSCVTVATSAATGPNCTISLPQGAVPGTTIVIENGQAVTTSGNAGAIAVDCAATVPGGAGAGTFTCGELTPAGGAPGVTIAPAQTIEIQPGQPAGVTVSGEITMVPADGVVMDPNGGTLVVVGSGTVASEGGVITCGVAAEPAIGENGVTCVVIGGVQTGGAAGGATVPEAGQTAEVIIDGQVQTCTVSGAGGNTGAPGAAGTSSVQVPATSSPEAGTSAGGQSGQ